MPEEKAQQLVSEYMCDLGDTYYDPASGKTLKPGDAGHVAGHGFSTRGDTYYDPASGKTLKPSCSNRAFAALSSGASLSQSQVSEALVANPSLQRSTDTATRKAIDSSRKGDTYYDPASGKTLKPGDAGHVAGHGFSTRGQHTSFAHRLSTGTSQGEIDATAALLSTAGKKNGQHNYVGFVMVRLEAEPDATPDKVEARPVFKDGEKTGHLQINYKGLKLLFIPPAGPKLNKPVGTQDDAGKGKLRVTAAFKAY